MAMIFESITIPRSYAVPSSPITSSMRNSVKFLEFRGLKMRPCSVTRSSGPRIGRHRSGRGGGGGGGILCEAQGTAVSVPSLTDDTWQSLVLDCEVIVMVEFWAPWCGPCRMIHPVIDELAKEYAGKLKCYKVNTDECPAIATKYGIRSIPTVILFKNGEKKDTVIGAVPRSTLVTSIEKFL